MVFFVFFCVFLNPLGCPPLAQDVFLLFDCGEPGTETSVEVYLRMHVFFYFIF